MGVTHLGRLYHSCSLSFCFVLPLVREFRAIRYLRWSVDGGTHCDCLKWAQVFCLLSFSDLPSSVGAASEGCHSRGSRDSIVIRENCVLDTYSLLSRHSLSLCFYLCSILSVYSCLGVVGQGTPNCGGCYGCSFRLRKEHH